MERFASPLNRKEIQTFTEPTRLRKTVAHGHQRRGLFLCSRYCNALATAGTAAAQYGSAATGFHSCSKAMGTLTTLIVWLVCTLHDISPSDERRSISEPLTCVKLRLKICSLRTIKTEEIPVTCPFGGPQPGKSPCNRHLRDLCPNYPQACPRKGD